MRQQQLMQERSTASGLAGEASHRGLAGEASGPVLAYTTGQGLTASSSHWGLMPCAESSWLSAESAAAGIGTEHSSSRGQRRAALPAANRAMLERQVSTPRVPCIGRLSCVQCPMSAGLLCLSGRGNWQHQQVLHHPCKSGSSRTTHCLSTLRLCVKCHASQVDTVECPCCAQA
jgi:hypothetical protein